MSKIDQRKSMVTIKIPEVRLHHTVQGGCMGFCFFVFGLFTCVPLCISEKLSEFRKELESLNSGTFE